MTPARRSCRHVFGDDHLRWLRVVLLAGLALGPACLQPVRPTEPMRSAQLEDPGTDETSNQVTSPDPDPGPAPVDAGTQDIEQRVVELLAGMRVRLLSAEASLEVDGWVNMDRGPVELFACAPGGKTHESVVVLDCVPSGVHAGLLALGLSPGCPVRLGPEGVLQPPTGDGVRIELRWTDAAGQSQVARAEDWIWNAVQDRAMERAAWIFAGSFLVPRKDRPGETTYAADAAKTLVATYHDATAVLENPWPGGGDDTRYHANIHAVPEVGTPVTLRFSLASLER
jgi:hypothetical protein